MLTSGTPLISLWPLIHTWTLAANVLDSTRLDAWKTACRQLGLLGTEFEQRISDLDHYLDEIEIRFDEIAVANGLETSTSL